MTKKSIDIQQTDRETDSYSLGGEMKNKVKISIEEDSLYPCFYFILGKPNPQFDTPAEISKERLTWLQNTEKEFKKAQAYLRKLRAG